MRRLVTLVVGMVLGAVAMLLAFNFHVVRTPRGMMVVARTQAALTDLYADIRSWSVSDWQKHRTLTQAMLKAGHGDIVEAAVTQSLLDGIQQRRVPQTTEDTDDTTRQ